jgi:CheY-like chemotaxis protein
MRALLHVEDDDGAAVVFRAAVDEANIRVNIERVSDGEQALEYLRGKGRYSGVRRPDVVFLDLNMPRVNGWQVLMDMKSDDSLRSIPVVILSTSSRQGDKERARALGAQDYVIKWPSFEILVAELGSAYENAVS